MQPTVTYGQGSGAQSQVLNLDTLLDNLDCAGELIHVHGKLHLVTHTVTQQSGTIKATTQVNYQDVKGVGLDTGVTYRVTDSLVRKFSFDADASSSISQKLTTHFNVIGPDQEGDFFLHATFVEKFDPNGLVTFENFKFRSDCK
jgi:hypothetical protein